MATFNPRADLLRVQLDSIRAQAGVEWRCFISDDASGEVEFREIESQVAGDDRFVLSRSAKRLGFYRNFERSLQMVDGDFEFVALADQDDSWHPGKLSRFLDGIGNANLVYSDQRVVTTGGEVLSDTYWVGRRNNHTDLTSLLIANTITGAASLLRRDLLDRALPFPSVPGDQYHDHWLGLVALAMGTVNYIDEPLYDYVQHDDAVLGHDEANAGSRGRPMLKRLNPRFARQTLNGWASAYFDVYLRLQALAQALIIRCGDSMSPKKRKELEKFIATNRDPMGPVRLWLRSLRSLTGKNETLGVERVLARAVLYRHMVAVKNRLPDAVTERAESGQDVSRGENAAVIATDRMGHKIQPLATSIEVSAPERVNILIPAIDLEHFFGGYIAKFNLAGKLAASGRRVRIITVDPNPRLPSDWKEQIENYEGLEGVFGSIEVEFGRDGPSLVEVSPRDCFVATTWWTAHIAEKLVAQTEGDRFLYLIQEYEPLTVPPGSWAALAQDSYGLPHHALFSTSILSDFFRVRQYGVFGPGSGEAGSMSFQNAITSAEPSTADEISGRRERKLLFYARPEDHAARNMFELGLLALRRACAEGVFGREWTFGGIGSLGGARSISLGGDHHLGLAPRLSQSAYGKLLAGHDVGLALMYAPHPSLVPIEMASAGLVTVTNTYETKTSDSMKAISKNICAVEPGIGSLVAGLKDAAKASADGAARVEGADVNWSRGWDESFDGHALSQISELLDRC